MHRRQALKKTNWILTSSIFGPGLVIALQGCRSEIGLSDQLLILDPNQFDLVSAIADTILPRTNSPSASEVKVPQFLDLLLSDVLGEEVKKHLLDGIKDFDAKCQESTGKSFDKLSVAKQTEYLQPIDQQTMSQQYSDKIPFYVTLKKLCLSIYYSTEEGVKQNLNYRPIPGSYEGDVALTDDPIEIGNNM